jgi:phage-related minor tail protein
MNSDFQLTATIGTPNISEITRMFSKVKSVAEGSIGNIGTRRTEMALGRITGAANEFQKSLEASNARVIAFGASAGAIFAVRAAFEKLISSTVNVEKSITEINSLLNIGGRDLASFTTKLFQTANQMGATFEDAAKAAAEFSRQGLSAADTLQRTGSALALARLSGLNLESAVTSLTAAMNSFKKEALSDIEVINRMAAVDAKFAVSTKDLAEGIKRVGSTADDANVSFNETISLITAAQQTTARGGAVIGY